MIWWSATLVRPRLESAGVASADRVESGYKGRPRNAHCHAHRLACRGVARHPWGIVAGAEDSDAAGRLRPLGSPARTATVSRPLRRIRWTRCRLLRQTRTTRATYGLIDSWHTSGRMTRCPEPGPGVGSVGEMEIGVASRSLRSPLSTDLASRCPSSRSGWRAGTGRTKQ